MKGLQEAILASNKEYRADFCVAYTVLDKHGECLHTHEHACYGGIGRYLEGSVAIINQIQRKYRGYFSKLPASTARSFINWVVNESVYKDVFVEHDVDKILKENAWVVRTDLPGNVVVSAMTVMRALTEWDRGCLSAKFFTQFTDAGISPEFSFILGHYLDRDMKSISSGYDSHHCAIPKDQMTIGAVVNFCQKRFTQAGNHPFNVERSYAGVHELFRTSRGNYDLFFKWLSEEYKKLGSARVSFSKTDPFADEYDEVVEYVECVDNILPDLQVIYNKFKEQFLTEPKGTAHE